MSSGGVRRGKKPSSGGRRFRWWGQVAAASVRPVPSSQVNRSPNAPAFLKGRALIVFGAGYVGGAVVERALAGGARVTALTRNRAQADHLAAMGASVVVADLAEAAAWRNRIPTGADFVLNCVSSGGAGIEGYRRSYVEGMRAILEWALDTGSSKEGCGMFIYTSSTSVYPQTGGARIDETASTGGGDRAQVLLEAEALGRGWPGPATVLRLAGIYGPRRHHLLDALREEQAKAQSAPPAPAVLPGEGRHRLNLIHLDDVVGVILAAFANPTAAGGETFNVVDDQPVTKAELGRWLAERLAQPPPLFSGVSVPGRRAVPLDRVIGNAKLKRMLGWRPRHPSFREGYATLFDRG